MGKTCLGLYLGMGLMSLSMMAFAGPNPAVQHSHDGRTHTHPLPDSGLNHQHNKGGGASHSQAGNNARKNNNNQSSTWVLMVKSRETYPVAYYVNPSTLKVSGDTVRISGRSNNSAPDNKAVIFYQWSVSLNDCKKRQGLFKVADAQGIFLYSSDFLYGAGSIASKISEQLCDAALGQVR